LRGAFFILGLVMQFPSCVVFPPLSHTAEVAGLVTLRQVSELSLGRSGPVVGFVRSSQRFVHRCHGGPAARTVRQKETLKSVRGGVGFQKHRLGGELKFNPIPEGTAEMAGQVKFARACAIW
jgi:hypothetical protein